MGKIISIDSYDVTRQMDTIANKNPDTEMAIAGGGKVIDRVCTSLQHVLEYEGSYKQQGQVSFTEGVHEKTTQKLAQKGYDCVAQGHDHLQKYNHAHNFSEQDKLSIKRQAEPFHLLLYKTEENTLRLKAVDNDMNPVKLVIMGKSMDIAEIFSGGNKVEEYKEAA